jgi:hypothetical protein
MTREAGMKSVLVFIALVSQAGIAFAAEKALSDEYLKGRWTTDGKAGCTSDQATYVVFDTNHTLQAGKGESVSTVGFWQIGGDRVIVHLLVSPEPGREAHPFFQQNYHYQYMSPKILAIRSDGIDYTYDTGVEAGNKRTLTRCR